MPVAALLCQFEPCAHRDRQLAGRIQRTTTAQQLWLSTPAQLTAPSRRDAFGMASTATQNNDLMRFAHWNPMLHVANHAGRLLAWLASNDFDACLLASSSTTAILDEASGRRGASDRRCHDLAAAIDCHHRNNVAYTHLAGNERNCHSRARLQQRRHRRGNTQTPRNGREL